MYPKTFFEQTKPQPESGQCFVLMPFASQFQEVYDAIVEALEGPELNFSCTRADELFGGGHIIEDILRCIGKAEVVIADVTTKNPNVFYELGITHMAKDLEKVLILTQDMNDVPFDLRHFRCIIYQQSNPGLKQLQKTLISSVKEISKASYRFSIKDGEQYKFPHKLFGPDRCFHDFEITKIWAAPNAAKFYMKEYRHILGKPVETVKAGSYGIIRGEGIELAKVPWRLVLEEVHADTAHFRVVPKK
jgi:hypothetical protein